MWDILLKSLGWIWALITTAIPPLVIELHRLEFYEIQNGPTDVFVIISTCPRSYHCELSMTNRKPSANYVREVQLKINGLTIDESQVTHNLRFEPSERKTLSIVFPVDGTYVSTNNEAFVLSVIPTVGRQSKVRGNVPVLKGNS